MFPILTDKIYFRRVGEDKVYSATKKYFGSWYYVDFGDGEKPYAAEDVILQFAMGRWIKVDIDK